MVTNMIKNNHEYQVKYSEYMELLAVLRVTKAPRHDLKVGICRASIKYRILVLEKQLNNYKGTKLTWQTLLEYR